jgi:hypothetical protein
MVEVPWIVSVKKETIGDFESFSILAVSLMALMT